MVCNALGGATRQLQLWVAAKSEPPGAAVVAPSASVAGLCRKPKGATPFPETQVGPPLGRRAMGGGAANGDLDLVIFPRLLETTFGFLAGGGMRFGLLS